MCSSMNIHFATTKFPSPPVNYIQLAFDCRKMNCKNNAIFIMYKIQAKCACNSMLFNTKIIILYQ